MRSILVGSHFDSPGALKRLWPKLKIGSKDLVIGLDGGLSELVRIGARVDLATGDWDSLKGSTRQLGRVPHLTLPVEKDLSDLHYGLALALMAGATEIVCLGVTGGRPDQQLATLMDLTELARVAKTLGEIRAIDETHDYRWTAAGLKSLRMSYPRGTGVSVFAMGGPATGVTLEGFRFVLSEGELEPSSQGMSNVVTSVRQRIQVRKGVLLAIVSGADRRGRSNTRRAVRASRKR